MTVETAFFIKDLNEAYPRSRDLINEGDDHIRLIKSTVKNTFPGIDKAVTYSADSLNNLNTITEASASELKVKSNLTVSSGKVVNLGGGAVKGVGTPVDDTDAVNLGFLKTSATWPINSIYMTIDTRNPNAILGFGTWEAVAQGRVIIGSGTTTDTNNESRTFLNNTKSGEFSHRIIQSEMPQHSHGLSSIVVSSSGDHSHDVDLRVHSYAIINNNYWTAPLGEIAGENSRFNNNQGAKTKTSGAHTHTLSGSSDNVGGTDRMNIVQPHFVCNIWIRTA